jgi:hypothetical protein
VKKFAAIGLAFLLLWIAVPVDAASDVMVPFAPLSNAATIFTNLPPQSLSGTYAYILTNIQPQSAVTVYITNTSASVNILYSVFSTGSLTVPNYSSNTQYWNSVSTFDYQNGYQPDCVCLVTIAANSTISIGVKQTNAVQLAIVLVYSSGSSSAISAFAVFSQNGDIPRTSVTGIAQQGLTLNSSLTNATPTVTIPVLNNGRTFIFKLDAFCSAGTGTLTITSNGVTIWTSPTGAVTTAMFDVTWPVGLAMPSIYSSVITLTGCTTSGTLNYQTSTL